ncbi:hypothetical protein [Haloactinopolyspora sp.]|uniref:hypothetical protein n=1 Tax=Haloactinopolyspora sp. TaxID=1966353 RepID=UPI00261522EE|nr:hypothetical protein [Haloactinopolyspora sp.]
MDRAFAAEIHRVDQALSMLVEHRQHSADPVDIIHTGEKIDQWLDKRLIFMRGRDESAGRSRDRIRQGTV